MPHLTDQRSQQCFLNTVPLPSPNLSWQAASCTESTDVILIYNGTPLQYSCLENPMDGGAWRAAVHGVAEGRTQLSDFTFTFHFHALEKEMATHSSVLAWRIPGMGETGGLPSLGSHRVGHDWSDLAQYWGSTAVSAGQWDGACGNSKWNTEQEPLLLPTGAFLIDLLK